MTAETHPTDLQAPLLALVAKWRAWPAGSVADNYQAGQCWAANSCASELQAAIASLAAHRGEVSGDVAAALDAVYDDFCAKDNGDVPLERYPQGAIDALARAGWAVVPCNLPHKVLGNAAVTGVLETGNPKHCWDYLIAHTRIYPNQPLPPQAQAGAGDAWLPIETAPKDGTPHLRGLHVFRPDGSLLGWQEFAGHMSDDGIDFIDADDQLIGWEPDDYTHWCPLPAPPALEASHD